LNLPAHRRDYSESGRIEEGRAVNIRHSIFALAALMTAIGSFAAPASADIEKFMLDCDGKLCPFFRASLTVPAGWVENKEATRALHVQMLLPQGQEFEDAPAKIYAMVRYNRQGKQTIADMVKDTLDDWKQRAKSAKTAKLPEIARDGGKPAFVSQAFEAPRLKEQGFERVSITTDTDKDGNAYFVVIVLSANSRAAYEKSEAAYNSVLKSY
jgi:hypothetical protein